MSPGEIELSPGGTEQLKWVSTAGPPGSVAWSSSDSAVVRVAEDGRVEGIAPGAAIVTARIGGLAASAAVRVRWRFASVHPGQEHTCALTSDGRALCWGGNASQQLGDPGVPRFYSGGTQSWVAASPRPVVTDLRFRSMASGVGGGYYAGFGHTCAVAQSGQAYCWGSARYGQVGDGSAGDMHTVGRPTAVRAELRFASLSLGDQFSCGVTVEGAGYCWGLGYSLGTAAPILTCRNRYGHASGACSPVPLPVAGGLVFSSISAGLDHACGVTASNEAYCWGPGIKGALGLGRDVTTPLPGRVVGGIDFAEIAAGGGHTCALDSAGRAYCWGSNARGELGTGAADTLAHTTPAPVATDVRFRRVAAGADYTCAITSAGEAYCWGDNSTGQIGDGSVTSRHVPTRVAVPRPLVSIAAGLRHICGTTGDGAAYCWGSGATGQLGHGSVTSSTRPVRVVGG
ncbi:MAG: Ig-like domain-containing protein [Gemmatimonadetes bacterium]|nr:Ig-like domain-containing protein [Gemmatimonadota bacterium]